MWEASRKLLMSLVTGAAVLSAGLSVAASVWYWGLGG